MKWRRKKSPTGHAPLPQIFPISWLSKLKQMSSTTKTKPPLAKAKPKVKPESSWSSNIPVCFRPPRQATVGSNSPAREGIIRKKKTEFMVPREDMRHSSLRMQRSESEGSGGCSEDESAVQFLSCDSCRSDGKSAAKEISEFLESGKFGDMLSEVTKTKFKTRLEKERSKSVDYRLETPKWIAEHELRTADKRISEDDMVFGRRSFHEDHVGMKRQQKMLDPLSDRSIDEGHHRSLSLNIKKLNQRSMNGSTILSNSEQKLVKDDQEFENVPSKSNEQGGGERNSCHGNKDLNKRIHRPRTGMQSPRTAMRLETCKIRAVEELKANRKREKQRGRAFESLAVVKCSFNPQQDFRESMVEMIAMNGIRHPEELESLLACYLSLNSEEYHSIIVKVFRQVWFDLNQDSSVSEFEERHYYQQH